MKTKKIKALNVIRVVDLYKKSNGTVANKNLILQNFERKIRKIWKKIKKLEKSEELKKK